MAIKLDEEKKKHDDLLEEKLELDEKMLQTNIQFEEYKDRNSQTTEVIAQLKAKIEE